MASHSDTEALWRRALEEDSNRALDWLWLYAQVESEEQRQFCLRKVQYITGAGRTGRPGDDAAASHRCVGARTDGAYR